MIWSDTLQQEWQTACQRLGLFPQADEAFLQNLLAQYSQLYEALMAYNQKVNLTRITEPREVLYRHLLDSLILSPYLPEGVSVVDIGSGAGFPALPLVLARPDLQVTAVESVGKKCAFMTEVREQFGLGERFTVLNARSEALGQNPKTRESFDIATARAVAALPVLLELASPLLKPQGRFIAMKGPTYQEELEKANKAQAILKVKFQDVQTLQLSEELSSTLLIFEKTGITPPQYPRSPGTPGKKPL